MDQAYRTIDLNGTWQFCLGDVKRWTRVAHQECYDATKAGGALGDMKVFFEDNLWRQVSVPHDWMTELASTPDSQPSNGFKPRGKGWYYRQFFLPEIGAEETVLLEFEGVMNQCVVYVNGTRAMRNASGYSGFYADVTDYLLPGQNNLIAVQVDTAEWEGWWYEGAGIYRPVRLMIQPARHIGHLSTFVSATPSADGDWAVHVSTRVDNGADEAACTEMELCVLDAQGREMARQVCAQDCAPFAKAPVEARMIVARPNLWSPDQPALYTLRVRLSENGALLQEECIAFGFRDILWTTDRGMLINGVPTPVNGICCHQDHVGVGIAVTKSLLRYRVKRLKAMSCNAYRCAHNEMPEDFLRICDELGMLVMAENRHFDESEDTYKALDSLVMRARNHPSVFLYSLFNEEPWQAEPRGRRIAQRLLRRVRRLDPTRPVTAAMNGGVLTRENASDVLDVAGMNYFIDDYMTYAKRRPEQPMVGTENGPCYATRGVYRADPVKQVYDCYGETAAPFGNRMEDTMEAAAAAPQVAGVFMWGGFDYRGEPQPFEWPSVFSHWGFHDSCGFEKDTFYQLKSYYSREKMLHLLPHWNWRSGEMVRVCVFTNCDAVSLTLNGRSLGTRAVKRNRAEWQVPFEPGELCAQAQTENGLLWDKVRTAGAPARMEAHNAATEADADTLLVNIDLVDENGVHVPDQERVVRVEVHDGILIGSGNGDPNGTQPDRADTQTTFGGRCQFIVRPTSPDAHVTVHAEGLPDVQVQ